jgi:hypothetical protein
MKKDRLRDGSQKIRNLDDNIEAHKERKSLTPGDIESLEADLNLPDDTEQTWTPSEQDFQPTDYEDHYDEALDTYATDDMDQVIEEEIHIMGEMTPDDVVEEPTTEVMPDKFTPEDESPKGT